MSKNTGPKLLVVHHSKEHAEDIALFFTGHGYLADSCFSIKEAEKVLETYNYECLLLSALMPDGNSLDFCRELKRDISNQSLTIILLSSIAQSGRFSLDAKNKYHADLYIEEPIPMQDIIVAVNEVLYSKGHKKKAGSSGIKSKSDKLEQNNDLNKFSATLLDDENDFTAAASPESSETTGVWSLSSTELPFEGTFDDFLFPELLLSFYQRRAYGNLLLRNKNEERIIYLAGGIPQFIKTNFIHEESLGQILVKLKKISVKNLKKMLRMAKESGSLIGQILTENGFLTPGELEVLLKMQARFKLTNAFKINEGKYQFHHGSPMQEIQIRFDLSILQILHAGVRRHMSLEILEKKIFKNRNRIVERKTTERLEPGSLGLNREQWALTGLADGKLTLGDVISESRMNFRMTFQTIYLLFLFGLFRFSTQGPGFFQIEEAVLARVISESKNTERSIEDPLKKFDKIPARGEVTRATLPLLLYLIYTKEKTGILNIENDSYHEELTLRYGRPVKIESKEHGDMVLGEILVRMGRITEEGRESALEESKKLALPLGEILISQGLVSPHEIFETLNSQVTSKLEHILSLSSGLFTFKTLDPSEVKSEMIFNVNIANLAVSAMKETMVDEKLEQDFLKFKSLVPEFALVGKQTLETLIDDPREKQLVGLINSRRSLAQIVERSSLVKPDALRVLFVLVHLKLVRFIQE